MTIKIKVEKTEDLKNFRTKIQSMRIQLWQFQAITIRKLANSILVDTIQKRMRDEHYSEKIIVNTILSDVKFISRKKIRLYFKSDYFTETGFDIALVREKTGTRPYKVEQGGKVMRFIIGGEVLYRRSRKGIKALHIIHDTLVELAPTVQLQYESALQNWISKNLGGKIIAV